MFKFSFISLLAIFFLNALPVNAQTQTQELDSYSVSPRQLISLARQGRFKAGGIPSHNNFRQGVKTGRITAKELIASAITHKRLPAEAIGDRSYLNAVNDHLKSGGCGT